MEGERLDQKSWDTYSTRSGSRFDGAFKSA